jgi:hypothetical protein
MVRLRRWSVIACLAVLATIWLSPVSGQAPAPVSPKVQEKSAAEKWLLDRSLEMTPQPAPVPALKYRLFPLSSELKEGNAVPIYLRLVHEQSDAAKRRWVDIPTKWNELPLDQLPIPEVRKFVKEYGNFYRQFDLGSRRRTAEWNYTLDQGSVIDILLPDVQIMRGYIPMMLLRARVELGEGNYPAAASAFETGFAFSRHVAEGSTLIHGLVGIAGASQFADGLLDWVARPDAPNLYWSLVALPRPLIDLRKGMEFEQKVMELQFPDLADLDRPRSPEQWDGVLKRVRIEFQRIADFDKEKKLEPPPGTTSVDPASKSPDLPAARKFLADAMKKAATEIDAMPPAQILLLFMAGYFKDLRDDQFKAAYLAYPESRPIVAEAQQRLQSAPATEATRLAQALMPAIGKVQMAQIRLDRKIAALRVIEALRLYAAAHDGRLPDDLTQVTEVPVPNDPGIDKPFEYHRDGQIAVLTSRIPGEMPENNGLRYRLTIRKK